MYTQIQNISTFTPSKRFYKAYKQLIPLEYVLQNPSGTRLTLTSLYPTVTSSLRQPSAVRQDYNQEGITVKPAAFRLTYLSTCRSTHMFNDRSSPTALPASLCSSTLATHVKTFHKYSCWFFVFLGFFFKYCLLLCLKEKKKYSQKKREIRPQPGPSDRCSASLLRHKALSGAEESQRGLKTCLDAFLLPSEVFQAPSATQIAKDFQQQGR